jgi:hypothetical protein
MRARFLLPLLLVLLSLATGCSDSPTDTFADSAFVGAWYLDPAADPGGSGWDLDILGNGTINFSHNGALLVTGSCQIEGDNLTGSWRQIFGTLDGTLLATLTNKDQMTFDFIENKPEGIKHVWYNGTRK